MVRPSLGELAEEVLEMHSLARIGAVQGLVQDQNLGIVHQGRGEPHPLAHAPRVRPHRAVLGVGEIDPLDGAVDRLLRIARPRGPRPSW